MGRCLSFQCQWPEFRRQRPPLSRYIQNKNSVCGVLGLVMYNR